MEEFPSVHLPVEVAVPVAEAAAGAVAPGNEVAPPKRCAFQETRRNEVNLSIYLRI